MEVVQTRPGNAQHLCPSPWAQTYSNSYSKEKLVKTHHSCVLPEKDRHGSILDEEFVVVQGVLQPVVFMPVLSNPRDNGMAGLHHNGAAEDLWHLSPNALECTPIFDRKPGFPASASASYLCLPLNAVSICLCLCN